MRFEIFCDQVVDLEKRDELKRFLEQVDYCFCLVSNCDSNYRRLRDLTKGVKKALKRKTFTDCARKTPEEVRELYEYKKNYSKEHF